MAEPEMETQRNVFSEEGFFLSVGPWPDNPENVMRIIALGNGNKQYFGDVEVTGSPKFMRLLGKALILCADDLTNRED